MTSTIALIEWLDDKADDPAYFAHERQMFKAIVAKLSELTTLLERCEKAEAEKQDLIRREFMTNKRAEKAEARVQELKDLHFDLGVQYDKTLKLHIDRADAIRDRAELAERQRDEALKSLDEAHTYIAEHSLYEPEDTKRP